LLIKLIILNQTYEAVEIKMRLLSVIFHGKLILRKGGQKIQRKSYNTAKLIETLIKGKHDFDVLKNLLAIVCRPCLSSYVA